MEKCIIGMCIMVTCIGIKNICIIHAYNHQGQESYIHACFRTKVQYHRYVHHTHIMMRVSMMGISMMHVSIMLVSMMPAGMMHVSMLRISMYLLAEICDARIYDAGINDATIYYAYICDVYIRLLESPCPLVRNKICRIIHTCIRINDHRCMHHAYIHQDQGS